MEVIQRVRVKEKLLKKSLAGINEGLEGENEKYCKVRIKRLMK